MGGAYGGGPKEQIRTRNKLVEDGDHKGLTCTNAFWSKSVVSI